MNPERVYSEHRDDALAKQVTAEEYSTFVAMPFTENKDYHSKKVFRDLICAAAARASERRQELRRFGAPHRSDESASVAVVITEEIVVDILQSHFVVADLTLANVGALLETGVALGLKPTKQTILLYRGDYSDLHFDIRNNRVISYSSCSDTEAMEKLVQAFLASARAFENDRQRYVDFVKNGLTPDAVQWLRIYSRLWEQRPLDRPSLHRGILDALNGGKYRNDPIANFVFINGTRELLAKRLMKTEYNVSIETGTDHFGMQATNLGRAVIKQMWGVSIPLLE